MLVILLLVGCDAGAPPQLGTLPEGEPAVVEPGFVESRITTSQAIELVTSGGMGGGGYGNIRIWEDGTVLFDRGACPRGKGRRGKLSPARVRAVLDTLYEAQFFQWSSDRSVDCVDCFTTTLTVKRGSNKHTVFHTGGGLEESLPGRAIKLVMDIVGKNACMP